MDHLPLFVKLEHKPCLVVGGGAVAARKVALLRRAGARVTVLAPRLNAVLAVLRADGNITHRAGFFDSSQIAGQRLVIAATGNVAVNRAVARAADAAGVLCNVVDDEDASSCILPAIVDRSPVIVAIGTGGNAPALAQRLKSGIEAWLPARIGELAGFAGRWREPVKRRLRTTRARRRFWQRFFNGPLAADILAHRTDGIDQRVAGALAADAAHSGAPGEAYIVGAGPGDPGLVTLRGQQLISQADVILYDRLVAPQMLDYARKEAELIAVGKVVGGPADHQQAITRLLVALVREGKRVCRLKGGDPFIFGRGGEEVLALKAAGLPYQIVPGISAALGCAAYAGIPLTLRGASGSVTLATARLGADRTADWRALARSGQTLALYMSAGAVDDSAAQLMRHGLAGSTPAAMVENGTLEHQRVLHSTLAELADAARRANITAPAVLFVGAAVARGRELAWFGSAVDRGIEGSKADTPPAAVRPRAYCPVA